MNQAACVREKLLDNAYLEPARTGITNLSYPGNKTLIPRTHSLLAFREWRPCPA